MKFMTLNELHKLLVEARQNGLTEVVRLLINEGADVTAFENHAIRHAAGAGQVEIVRLLIEAGADVTALNNCALRWAADEGHTEVVSLLTEAGATLPRREG